ncbi:AmmeMemoRadiSam system protein B [Candidatus Kuenenbacteria bacterium]|nr:AmmeMemoRadiSam system protein B [Candidatus Kuenenbacteria bacterium]
MKKLFLFALFLSFTIIILIIVFPKQKPTSSILNNNQNTMTTPKIIRQPAVAGQFYPTDKKELSSMIERLLANATTTITGKPQIFIVPHAGYVFSGETAAYAFKTVADISYDTVIVLGGSHNYPIDGLILYNGDAVSTPLGEVSVDKKLTEELIATNQNISADNKIHEPEHSLEVQLPFLQKTLVPGWQSILGLINSDDNETLASIADSIEKVISGKNVLLIISSDLSHYPSYANALYSDTKIIDSILTKDINNFDQTFSAIIAEGRPNLDTCACGSSAIKVGMIIANELNLTGNKLHYSNSGDTPDYGDKSRVVGYGAVVFTNNKSNYMNNNNLNPDEQAAALSLARNTLELAFNLTTDKNEDYKQYPVFSEKRGIFVTLRKNEELRGCIGLIEPIKELSAAIIEMTEAAAFEDPRFLSLEKNELKDITIEVSVLTPPQKISGPKTEIELGRHGVIVKKGSRSGVFLPQVATETGWDLNTFMAHLCADKAGLPANCWLDGSADIYTFEAQVFEEK